LTNNKFMVSFRKRMKWNTFIHCLMDAHIHLWTYLLFYPPLIIHLVSSFIFLTYMVISSVTYKLQVIALVNMLNMVRMMASLGFVVAFLTKGYLHKYWLPDVTLYFSPNQWMSMCDFRVCSSITVFECTHLFGVLWYLE